VAPPSSPLPLPVANSSKSFVGYLHYLVGLPPLADPFYTHLSWKKIRGELTETLENRSRRRRGERVGGLTGINLSSPPSDPPPSLLPHPPWSCAGRWWVARAGRCSPEREREREREREIGVRGGRWVGCAPCR